MKELALSPHTAATMSLAALLDLAKGIGFDVAHDITVRLHQGHYLMQQLEAEDFPDTEPFITAPMPLGDALPFPTAQEADDDAKDPDDEDDEDDAAADDPKAPEEPKKPADQEAEAV